MEFFSVMGQVWSKYSHLFLHGLWMTVYMGLVTVAISTVTGSILALLRRSSFKPLQWIVTAYVEIIRGTPILLQLYFFYFMLVICCYYNFSCHFFDFISRCKVSLFSS